MRDRAEIEGARAVWVVVDDADGEDGRGTTPTKGAKLAVEGWLVSAGRIEGAIGEAWGENGWRGDTPAASVGCTPAVVMTGPLGACVWLCCAYGSEWSNCSGCEWIGSVERGAGGSARRYGPAGAE